MSATKSSTVQSPPLNKANSEGGCPDSVNPIDPIDSVLLISGLTVQGKKFRPSDWCERLYGTIEALKNEDFYDEAKNLIQLIHHEGQKCILIHNQLRDLNLMVYNFYQNFANQNNLATFQMSKDDWDKKHNSTP